MITSSPEVDHSSYHVVPKVVYVDVLVAKVVVVPGIVDVHAVSVGVVVVVVVVVLSSSSSPGKSMTNWLVKIIVLVPYWVVMADEPKLVSVRVV